MTTALLIIDVQEALCTGEHAAFEAERVIERIKRSAFGCPDLGSPQHHAHEHHQFRTQGQGGSRG